MVSLTLTRAANSGLVGGTSGICEYTLRALVSTHGDSGPGLRIYIVGRNAKAAETIIADCRRVCHKGEFKFVRAEDLALLKDVDRVCKEVIDSEQRESLQGGKARVDLLVMSQVCAIFQPS
ncbi:hypothetical protein V1524DRAFT_82877 [Lipomyces starkeyi]